MLQSEKNYIERTARTFGRKFINRIIYSNILAVVFFTIFIFMHAFDYKTREEMIYAFIGCAILSTIGLRFAYLAWRAAKRQDELVARGGRLSNIDGLTGRADFHESFEVFLQSFQNGKAVNPPEELVRKLFLADSVDDGTGVFKLKRYQGGRSELRMSKDCPLAGVTISRPPQNISFWRDVLSFLKDTPSCLHWPGGWPVIAQASVRDHLPPTMIEALGEPELVSTPEQIKEAIRES